MRSFCSPCLPCSDSPPMPWTSHCLRSACIAGLLGLRPLFPHSLAVCVVVSCRVELISLTPQRQTCTATQARALPPPASSALPQPLAPTQVRALGDKEGAGVACVGLAGGAVWYLSTLCVGRGNGPGRRPFCSMTPAHVDPPNTRATPPPSARVSTTTSTRKWWGVGMAARARVL